MKVPESKVEEAVSQQQTIEEEVVREYRRATLEDIMQLPFIRKAKAKPYVIPGTDLEVLIAPVTPTEAFKASLAGLKALKMEDEDERVAFMLAQANGIIKCCVVEPELTDAALEALNEFNIEGFQGLVQECRNVSGLGGDIDTAQTESF
jgi:hypothetical protein